MTMPQAKKTEDPFEDVYVLSPTQEGLLFHALYAPGSGVYVQQVVCTLDGELSPDAFRGAWDNLLLRHPVLRSFFLWEKRDKPLQVVRREVRLPWQERDWSGLAPERRAEELERFLEADRQQGFDLSKAPLLRVALLRLGERSWQFVWTFHHLLLDGWSNALALKELAAIYNARLQGGEVDLPPVPPFRSYIAWLRRRDPAAEEELWRRFLVGIVAPTPLPGGRPREAAAEGESYEERVVSLSPEATAALRAMAQQAQITLSTVVQGAWALLLSRYAGEDDVIFGTTVSGRPPDLPGVDAMIGVFINSLPVRVTVVPEEPLVPWLRRIQASQNEARQHEHTPLVRIREWSEIPRDLPLFESLVIFQNFPLDESLLSSLVGLEVKGVRFVARSNYPLTAAAVPGPRLLLRLAFDRHRFDVPASDRLLRHWATLLAGMAARPRLRDLSLLDPAARAELLQESAGARLEVPTVCIHHLFEAWAARAPDSLAVGCGGSWLSYGELDRRANQLARHLRARGVGPQVRVAICLERSAEMAVAILGVLKAGGTYVPLDPGYPRDRLAFMLADARPKVLVLGSELLGRLPETSAELVRPDVEWPEIARRSHDGLAAPAWESSTAYVIYTSGSTGNPKGVAISHGNLCHYVHALSGPLGVGPGTVYLHTASFAFSSSVRQLLLPLSHGAAVVIASNDEIADPVALFERVRQSGVTVVDLVPSYWRNAVDALERLGPGERARLLDNRLRLLLSASEPLLSDVPRAWAARFGHPALFVNMFGQTETAGIVSTCPLEDTGTAGPVEVVAIGRPIANARLYVLDPSLEPAPVGAPGEICIGGPGIGQGYVGLPAQTAERFIPDPFADLPGSRLYRTGDLGRRRADANVDFLGRRDHQVKVRGFRVEPGEIEGTLRQLPGVRDAVAVVRSDGAGEHRLVAYVVPAQGARPGVEALRSALEERLPAYMVPAAFVLLDSLPVTPTGKIDRRALPEPDASRPDLTESYVEPRTPEERQIAGIWAKILRVERVGVHDNFSKLGGHSLMATQIISRVRDAFKVDLPLRTLFEAPTVAGMAERVEQARRQGGSAGARALTRVDRGARIPLSFAQQRMWVLYRLDPRNPFYNIPAALRLRGPLDVPALAWSLREIVRRHEALRTAVQEVGGQGYQRIVPAEEFELRSFDLAGLPPEMREPEVRRLSRLGAWHPFDLTRDVLLRAMLLRLDEEDHVILLVTHHISYDGWSTGVFVREVEALYRGFREGVLPELPELLIQYADFTVWQREHLQGKVYAGHLDYWRRRLAGAPQGLNLPMARTRPAEQTFRGDREFFSATRELTDRLKALSQQAQVTLFTTLLSAFKTLIHRYTGQRDVVVGTPIANRNRTEIEGLVGFFSNTLVLRTDLGGDPTFRELMGRFHEVAMEAAEHQDMPFDQLVRELQPERHLDRNPMFQVMFNVQNAPMENPRLGELALEPFFFDITITHFDISFYIWDTPRGLRGMFNYSTDLFDQAAVRLMLGHYITLLEGVVASPDLRLSNLPLVSPAERERILSFTTSPLRKSKLPAYGRSHRKSQRLEKAL